jgi:tetratricopeptide (TPR) repeat protein
MRITARTHRSALSATLPCLGLLALLTACAACSPKTAPFVTPVPAAPAEPSPAVRLAGAHALVRLGCLDCLLEANRTFELLRVVPDVADQATVGAIQSAALVALRERGLGMLDSGYLLRARAIASSSDDLQVAFGFALDVVDTTPQRIGRVLGSAADPESERRSRLLQQNRARWLALLSVAADADPFSAAIWVSFSCLNSQTLAGRAPEALLKPLTAQKDAPLVLYEVATCSTLNGDDLQRVADSDSRFHEADYWFGHRELGRLKLDEGQALLMRAYEWHPNWPSAAVALAGLFMTGEDFVPALEYYDRALSLLPALGEAMVGRVRALSYLERSAEALAAADQLLPELPADAYYWRAWNRNQLGELDQAWQDILAAERVRVTNIVAKLAGLIAYRREERETARGRFETAIRLDASDCDSHFYLGGVRAELKIWAGSADAYLVAASCLGGLRARLVAEIAEIEASNATADRKTRRIASRRERITAADRMTRRSWFNLAAAYFNLGRSAEARQFAELVLDDEQFGASARELLDDLKP